MAESNNCLFLRYSSGVTWEVVEPTLVESTSNAITTVAAFSTISGNLFYGSYTYSLPTTWSARDGHSSVVMSDGSIVLMGGDDGDYKNDAWRSTDNGANWTQQTASAGWTTRSRFTSVSLTDSSITIHGGRQGKNRRNDVWKSTDKGANWTQQTASAEWTERYWHASVALTDDSIVLMGGDDGDYKNDAWRSTDNGATWTLLVGGSGETEIYTFDSSMALASSWITTNFPATPANAAVYGIASTTGTSGALYLPVTLNGISAYVIEGTYIDASYGSNCVITHASSGDVYNIGGISSDSTIHIVFTMWDNYAYGRGK